MEIKLSYALTKDGQRREAAGSIDSGNFAPHAKGVDLMLAQLGSSLIDMVEEPPEEGFFPDELFDPNIHGGPDLSPFPTKKPWRN